MSCIKYIIFLSFCLITIIGNGQEKEIKPSKSISIISDFKPYLRFINKLTFPAVLPKLDSFKSNFKYTIIQEKVDIPIESILINPVTLNEDSIIPIIRKNFFQIGYGSYNNLQFQFYNGNGDFENKNLIYDINYNKYKGNLLYQEYNQFSAQVIKQVNSTNFVHYFDANYSNINQYRYGIDVTSNNINKDEILVTNNLFNFKYNFTNKNIENVKISPIIYFQYFNDGSTNSKRENIFEAIVPIEKKLNESITFYVNTGLYTQHYTSTPKYYHDFNNLVNHYEINQSQFYINPALQINNSITNIRLRLNNHFYLGKYYFLPAFELTLKPIENIFQINGKIESKFIYNTYFNLFNQNNWVDQFNSFNNTKHNLISLGTIYNINPTLSFQAIFAYNDYYEMPLFINNINYRGYFNLLYETKLSTFKFDFILKWKLQENVHFNTNLIFENFTSLEKYTQAFGLIPLKINANLNWKLNKNLIINSSLIFLDGTTYKLNINDKGKQNAGLFVHINATYTIDKNWQIYGNINNLFDTNYARWTNYPSIGFATIAGIIYNFK